MKHEAKALYVGPREVCDNYVDDIERARNQVVAQGACAGRDRDPILTLIVRLFDPLDEAIALHTIDRPRYRRIFDADPPAQLSLRQAIARPEMQQDSPLAG